VAGEKKPRISVTLPGPDGEQILKQFKRYVFDKHGTDRKMGYELANILREFLEREGYWPPEEGK